MRQFNKLFNLIHFKLNFRIELQMSDHTAQERSDQEQKVNLSKAQSKKMKRQAPPDETMNTKTFIRKLTAKKEEPQKGQCKITKYINASNSTTLNSKDENANLSFAENSSENHIKELEGQLLLKDQEVERMKRSKDADDHKYAELYRTHHSFKSRSKMAVAKAILEAANCKRKEKREIDPKLGYFKDNGKTFVEGEMLERIKKKILDRQALIKEFENEKRSKDPEKKEKAAFRIDYLTREIQGYQKQMANLENYVQTYKQEFKLALKEENCEYALQGWPIVYDTYQTLELLGKGGFGEVYKVYDLEQMAVVSLKVNTFNQDPEYREEFIKHVNREADVMMKLKHPNIGRFLKVVECSQNKVVFTLEYCNGPELSVYLRRHKCLEEKEAKQIVKQLLSALDYLSSLPEKVIHYDLKPANVMFHDGQIKILDFGLCKPMGNEQSILELTSQGTGTYWYLPPETFNEAEFGGPMITTKVDVWSVGVIFFEMLYGRRPFGHGVSQHKIYNEGIILKAFNVEFPPETPKKFKVSDAAKCFIKELLCYKVIDRLSPTEAYQHEYLKK